ncbi:ATP phosphoribosyltransferase [Sandaracinobacteroides sayramensis]|uniref:ATP phosphoribosyltransferase n=1 Tax=Sandaracinobacteroides sayramensis TaxID=2913411 RepID=UPI001EDA1A20|nr:ATP phosphoribosyltransferase [Sandaracinobacteroides sayramensis]
MTCIAAAIMTNSPRQLVFALPKGRILKEALPLLEKAGIHPEPALFDEGSRALRFATSNPHVSVIRVRSFDVATFVAFGAAHLGIVGNDVLAEFDYSELYSPVDLGIGRCRLSVAEPEGTPPILSESHVRVATKYPHLTARHYAAQGVQAECVKLNGAMELAPLLGLAPRIVDLVSTGRTLKENGLVEREAILEVTSRLIVNRAAFKTMPEVARLVESFRALAGAA